MQDHYGESELCRISISNKEISFVKKYSHRKDLIKYKFTKKDGNTWVGTYDGSATGTGISRCMITEINEDFFSPESALKILGLKKAHKWPKK